TRTGKTGCAMTTDTHAAPPTGGHRVALVTGGGRGIGRAIALGLAADGCDVAVNYRRDAEAAGGTVAAIESLGQRAVPYRASVDDPDAALGLAADVLGDFGAVDILICNAGVASRGLQGAVDLLDTCLTLGLDGQ